VFVDASLPWCTKCAFTRKAFTSAARQLGGRCVAGCCRVLQGVAGCWCVLHKMHVTAFIFAAHHLGGRCVVGCCKMLQGVVRYCRVLQGVAGCCRVLQNVAVCVAQHARSLVRPSPSPCASWAAGVLQGAAGFLQGIAGFFSLLQRTRLFQ